MKKMYKWKLTFLMKNGEYLHGTYEGVEKNSDAVAKVLLKGDIHTFTGCRGLKGDSNLLICVGEIAALDIMPA